MTEAEARAKVRKVFETSMDMALLEHEDALGVEAAFDAAETDLESALDAYRAAIVDGLLKEAIT